MLLTARHYVQVLFYALFNQCLIVATISMPIYNKIQNRYHVGIGKLIENL